MNVSTHVVAPHTNPKRHIELAASLDELFREYDVPPGILQYTFIERRRSMHYAEILNILTPFPTHPSSELMEDIGQAVAPAQARIVGLQSSYYPPVHPPIPAIVYAPNEDDFVVARSQLLASDPNVGLNSIGSETKLESTLVLDAGDAGEITSTLSALFTAKARIPLANPDKLGHTTITIYSPSLLLQAPFSSGRHTYALHSLSATAHRDPQSTSPSPCTFSPRFSASRDQRFERTSNGLRHECTWYWEVLDDQLRANGVDASEISQELIIIDVPPSTCPSTLRPLSIHFSATLTATAGLDAIDLVYRSCWAPDAMQNLQSAFDRTHPAVQVLHHVIKAEVVDVGQMFQDSVSGERYPTAEKELYAPEVLRWFGDLRVDMGQDAAVLGRRSDEDEGNSSDEEEE